MHTSPKPQLDSLKQKLRIRKHKTTHISVVLHIENKLNFYYLLIFSVVLMACPLEENTVFLSGVFIS